MAALAEMGEVDEIVHSNEDSIKGRASYNGESCDYKDDVINCDSNDIELVHNAIDIDAGADVSPASDDSEHETPNHNENLDDEKTDDNNTTNGSIRNISLLDDSDSVDNDIEQITHDEVVHLSNGILEKDDFNTKDDSTILIHDSGENDDVLVIDDRDPVENGSIHSSSTSSRSSPSIEEQDVSYKKPFTDDESLRNTLRKMNESSYDVCTISEIPRKPDNDESGSDIEEILPEDPLADIPVIPTVSQKSTSPPIVVRNTKSLANISINSSSSDKNATLVIIDTNSILSGHGPIPVVHKPPPKPSSLSNAFPILPMALPAQGLYPANMRATITPIPSTPPVPKSTLSQPPQKQAAPAQIPAPPVLPTLTDDMYVVEAPSFIVPYVYEKPPVNDLKDIVKNLEVEIKVKDAKENTKPGEKDEEGKKDDGEEDGKDKPIDVDKLPNITALTGALKKTPVVTYFDSPLGKFFVGIGANLVQEHVQNDLLKQQKKKRDRESGTNVETLRTISSLLKNLEFTKENNEPFRMEIKRCETCNFKTESALAMSFHLETPHMKNFVYKCNFCPFEVRSPHDILYHMEVQHGVRGRLERAPAFHQCPNCPFEDNQKGKLSRHLVTCARKFKPERNLEPPIDYEPPAKIPRAPRMKQGLGQATAVYQAMARSPQFQMLTKAATPSANLNSISRNRGRPTLTAVPPPIKPMNIRSPPSMIFKPTSMSGGSVLLPSNYQMGGNQVYQPTQQQATSLQNLASKGKSSQPSISITPLPRAAPTPAPPAIKPGESNSKNSFVICEICDGYIKDLEQLRNHMQWIHKVKIHPKMIYNRPPLNCQKCQFRFFTDQGLERHLLGSHGLVTSSMQEAANKSKDSGRCPVCGRVYQWKLLNHVARDHNMSLKPAHLSYKCTVCTATFGMYKQFESHVYSAHSVVAKRAMDKKNTANAASSASINKNDSSLKPLKINDEITIIPQPTKPSGEDSTPSTSGTSVTLRNSIGQSNGSEIHEVIDDDSSSGSSLLREKRRKVSPSDN